MTHVFPMAHPMAHLSPFFNPINPIKDHIVLAESHPKPTKTTTPRRAQAQLLLKS
jgi:hypothetical protein